MKRLSSPAFMVLGGGCDRRRAGSRSSLFRRLGPDRANLHRRGRLGLLEIVVQAPLLVHVCLDDLRGQRRRGRSPACRAPIKPRPRCRDSVAAQSRRTMHSAARRHLSRCSSCRRCGLPPGPCPSCPQNRCRPGARRCAVPVVVAAAMPSVMVSQFAGSMGTVTSPDAGKRVVHRFAVFRRQLRGNNHVRTLQHASGGNPANGARQLDGRNRYRALPNTDGNGLAGIPLLVEIPHLPLFGGNRAAHLAGQIDAGLLPQSHLVRPIGNLLDAQLLRQSSSNRCRTTGEWRC